MVVEWDLALRFEYWLRAFENRVMRVIFGMGWGK
jgi:hypothetical protein